MRVFQMRLRDFITKYLAQRLKSQINHQALHNWLHTPFFHYYEYNTISPPPHIKIWLPDSFQKDLNLHSKIKLIPMSQNLAPTMGE
jgi:hypothetical protein